MLFDRAGKEGETYEVQHDLAEQHVLERRKRLRVVLRREVLECLEEVRVRGLVVFILGVQDAGL